MPVLTSAHREEVRARLARMGLHANELKPAHRSVVDAVDDWIESTGGALLNAALPVGFRTNATTKAKIELYAQIFAKRAGLL